MADKEKFNDSDTDSVDDILAGIMDKSGTFNEEFNGLFARYLGSNSQQLSSIIDVDLSDRTGERETHSRIEYEAPEAVVSRTQKSVDRKIEEKLPDGMRVIYSETAEDARRPEFTSDGNVRYPQMGVGASEERVVYDAEWEEKAKKEAASLDRKRQDNMLRGDSTYVRSFVSGGVPMARRTPTQPPKPAVNSAFIDPLSEEPGVSFSKASNGRSPMTADDILNEYNNKGKKPFFQEGFSAAQVRNDVAGGKTNGNIPLSVNAASDSAKAVTDEAVLDAFSQSFDSEQAFKERWKQTVEESEAKRREREAKKAESLRAAALAADAEKKAAQARREAEERISQAMNPSASPSAVQPLGKAAVQNNPEPGFDAEEAFVSAVKNTAPPVKNDTLPVKKNAQAKTEPAARSSARRSIEVDGVAVTSDDIAALASIAGADDKNYLTEQERADILSRDAHFSEKAPDTVSAGKLSDGVKKQKAPGKAAAFFKTRFSKEGIQHFIKNNFPAKGDSTREIVRKSIMDISFIALLCSAIYLGVYFHNYRARINNDNKLGEIFSEAESLENTDQEAAWANIKARYPDVKFPEGMRLKFASLYAMNQDVVGWLTIKNTTINTVLLQSTSNSTYLYKDINKEYSRYGNPYVDYRADMSSAGLSKNTIIYGHNTHDGLMFAQLTDYMTVEGYRKAPVITLDTLYETTYWKIFAVMLTNSTPDADNGYLFQYLYTDFSSGSSFMSVINGIEKRSMIHTGIDVNSGDKTLMIYTCYQNVFKGGRLVICARQLREGESQTVDTSKAYYNNSAHFPQAYYDKMNSDNPYSDETPVEEPPVTVDEPPLEDGNETAENTSSADESAEQTGQAQESSSQNQQDSTSAAGNTAAPAESTAGETAVS